MTATFAAPFLGPDLRLRLARNAVALVLDGAPSARVRDYLRDLGIDADLGDLLNAADYAETVQAYADPDHCDHDLLPMANRQEVNRLREEAAQRQLDAAVRRLAGVDE